MGIDIIEQNLNKNDEARVQLEKMCSEKEFPNETKTMLLIGYLNIAFEHQRAILLLIRNGLYGSASVLVRPIFDTLYRALWVCKCASVIEIEKLSRNDKLFTKNMINTIDQQYASDNFFSKIKKEMWHAMSSYVHSGLLPISRRFMGSVVQPNYQEGELIEIMSGATMSILFLSYSFFMNAGMYEEAKETKNMIMSYS